MKKNQIEQLEKEDAKIRAEINRMEEAEIQRVQIPHLKGMVGRCFVFKDNSYGGCREVSNVWDVYRKILEYVESKEHGFHFIVEEFEVDKNGKVSWIIDSVHPYTNRKWWGIEAPFSGYKKITEKEYEEEKIKMIAEMTTRSKMKKV